MATGAFSAEALLPALEPYGKVRRFPGRLRVIDIRDPYTIDESTRQVVGDALRPLLLKFFGPEHGSQMQRFADRTALLDRLLVVVGSDRHDLRSWITYTMLTVHRRPVMWVHAIVMRPGLRATRVAPLTLGYCLLKEWLHHRCQPFYGATITRNAQLIRFFRSVWGEDAVFPRPDGDQPADVRHVVEIVGTRGVHALRRSATAPGATLDLDAQIVRHAFGTTSDGTPPSDGGSPRLGPDDAYLVVVKVSKRGVVKALPHVPRMLRARRRAEARLGGHDAAQR